MSKLKDYELVHEAKDYFKIRDKKDGREFSIAKAMLDRDHNAKMSLLPKAAKEKPKKDIKEPIKAADGIKVPDPAPSEPAQDNLQDIIPEQSEKAPDPSAMPELPASAQKQSPDYFKNGTFDFNKFEIQNPNVPLETKTAALKQMNDQSARSSQDEQDAKQRELSSIAAYNKEAAKAGLPLKDVPADIDSSQPLESPGQQPSAKADEAPGPANPLKKPAELPSGLNPLDEYDRGLALQRSGIKQEADALAAKGDAEAIQYSKQIEDTAKNQKLYDDQIKTYRNQYDQLYKDTLDSKIKPNRVWDNMTTGNKILASIGMILGGAGAGITGGPNMAVERLNKLNNDDIAAQEKDLSNKQNLLSKNLEITKDLEQAKALTFNQLQAITAAYVSRAGALSQNPLAKAKAAQISGQLYQDSSQRHMGIAANQMLMRLGTTGSSAGSYDQLAQSINTLGVIDPAKAKEFRERLVPGFSKLADVPVPQEIRDQITARHQLDQAVANLRAWSQKNQGTLDLAKINEGKTLAAELQSMYRNSINGGVFKKGEQEFIGSIVDEDPTKFFNRLRVDPKFKAVQDSNTMQLNQLLKEYGLRNPTPTALNFTPRSK